MKTELVHLKPKDSVKINIAWVLWRREYFVCKVSAKGAVA